MTAVTQTVHQQRAAAYTTLAQLADRHGLPQPMDVSFLGENYRPTRLIEIRLDDDRRGSVEGWAKLLGLDPPASTEHAAGKTYPAFTAVKAQAWATRDKPLWLGFDNIQVWSACRPAAEPEPAGYAREVDNADEPVPVPPGVEGGHVGAGPGRHTETPADTAKDAR